MESFCRLLWNWKRLKNVFIKIKNKVVFSLFLKFLLNWLGWHWLIKLYRFQVYNSIIHYLYIVLCVHYQSQVFCYHLYLLYPLLLPPTTPLPSGHHHTVVCVCEFFLLSMFSLVSSFFNPAPQHPYPLTAVSLLSVSISLFLFCLLAYVIHYIPHVCEIIWCLSFRDHFCSLFIFSY